MDGNDGPVQPKVKDFLKPLEIYWIYHCSHHHSEQNIFLKSRRNL